MAFRDEVDFVDIIQANETADVRVVLLVLRVGARKFEHGLR